MLCPYDITSSTDTYPPFYVYNSYDKLNESTISAVFNEAKEWIGVVENRMHIPHILNTSHSYLFRTINEDEALNLCVKIYQVINFTLKKFPNSQEIIELCEKIDKFAFSIMFKYTKDNPTILEHMFLLGFIRDEISKSQVFLPKELVPIIIAHMVENALKSNIETCKELAKYVDKTA